MVLVSGAMRARGHGFRSVMALVGGLEQTYLVGVHILNIDTVFELVIFVAFRDEEQSREHKMGQWRLFST